jgi:hypothetical protein
MGHVAAGITDYFKAYRAKSYNNVIDNASSRTNPAKLQQESTRKVAALQDQLKTNRNLDVSDIKSRTGRREATDAYLHKETAQVLNKKRQHAIGDFFENAFGKAGSVGSAIGGTIGYGTKELIKAPFTMPSKIKRGLQSGREEMANTRQLGRNADALEDAVGTPSLKSSSRSRQAAADKARLKHENAVRNTSTTAKVTGAAEGAAVGAGVGAGAIGAVGAVKGVIAATHAVADSALPSLAGSMTGQNLVQTGRQVAESARMVKNQVKLNALENGHMPDEMAMAAQSLAANFKPMARVTGQAVKEYGQMVGKDAWRGAKTFHQNRNSRGVTIAATAGTLALAPLAYSGGANEAKHQHKMQQMAGGLAVSNDGGGTFLRDNQAPQVQDMGATGDLVFALHSLRGGG